jgi:hypothetical protein
MIESSQAENTSTAIGIQDKRADHAQELERGVAQFAEPLARVP